MTFLFKPIIKLETNKAYELFIISILIGNPSSASLIINELEAKTITENDAQKLIKITTFFNPLFIIFIITTSFLKEISYAFLIIISMLITNIIFSTLYKTKKIKNKKPSNQIIIKTEQIFNAINNVMYLLIIVAGVMVFNNIIKYSITNLFNKLDLNQFFFQFILANIEISTGVIDIINLNSKVSYTLSLICFLFTFQGISINMQVATIIKNLKLKFSSLLIIRFFQAIICSLICLMLFIIFFNN